VRSRLVSNLAYLKTDIAQFFRPNLVLGIIFEGAYLDCAVVGEILSLLIFC
jgi:hypothetical protein